MVSGLKQLLSSQREKRKPWYKTVWGLPVALIFFPITITYIVVKMPLLRGLKVLLIVLFWWGIPVAYLTATNTDISVKSSVKNGQLQLSMPTVTQAGESAVDRFPQFIDRVATLPKLFKEYLADQVNGAGKPETRDDTACRLFRTQREAQDYFSSIGGNSKNDADNLDPNHNGIPCELLPK